MGTLRERLLRLAGLLALAVAVSVTGIVLSQRLRPDAMLVALGTRPPVIDLLGPAPVRGDALAAVTSSGHPAVVEFFEAGCAVCQQSAPDLCAALRAHPEAMVIAVDAALDTQSVIDAFTRDHLSSCAGDPRLRVFADPCRPPGRSPCANVTEHWAVRFVPTVYVVAVTGRVAYAASGADAVAGVGPALSSLPHG